MLIWAESGTTFYSQDLPDAKPASQPASQSQPEPASQARQPGQAQPTQLQPNSQPSSQLIPPAPSPPPTIHIKFIIIRPVKWRLLLLASAAACQ